MTEQPVQLAVSLSHLDSLVSTADTSGLVDLARAVESAGAHQLVLSEHVALPGEIVGHPGARPGDPPTRFPFRSDELYPEPLIALAAIATATATIRLSTNVLIAPLRPAVLLAKSAATLDVLSGGRLDLGVGVGWQLDEFRALGVPFDGVGSRLEDTVRACRALWAGGPATFRSDTVSFEDLHCSPAPRQGVDFPVWFGGSARRAVARRVAELGHGWSVIGGTPPGDVVAGRSLIEQCCDGVGRSIDDIAIRCSLPLASHDDGTPDVLTTVQGARPFVDAGATVVQLPSLRSLLGNDAGRAGPVAEFVADAVDELARITGRPTAVAPT